MHYDNQWLIARYNAKEKIKFLHFWGHQPSKDGSITQSCFSQWWYAPFVVAGVTYKTAEHWMMAEKAKLFKDQATLEKILKANTPAEAKKLGRSIISFAPSTWDQYKFEIVVTGNHHKFTQQEDLKAFLLNTQQRILVEASPVDNIWGNGLAADHPSASNPLLWKGENLLGYALMEVRDKITSNER